jgi:hypothetical protein
VTAPSLLLTFLNWALALALKALKAIKTLKALNA